MAVGEAFKDKVLIQESAGSRPEGSERTAESIVKRD